MTRGVISPRAEARSPRRQRQLLNLIAFEEAPQLSGLSLVVTPSSQGRMMLTGIFAMFVLCIVRKVLIDSH